jgi:hypothetical protein
MMSKTRQFENARSRSLATILCALLGVPAHFQAATATATKSLSASLSPIVRTKPFGTGTTQVSFTISAT